MEVMEVMSEKEIPKILLIAPMGSGTSVTNVVGGNRVTGEEIVRELGMRGFDLDIVDTSGSMTNLPPWRIRAVRLARFLRVIWKTVKKIRQARLAFVIISPASATVVASSIWVICKIARRPMVVRFSGSRLSSVYRQYGAPSRWLAERTWMRCSLVYVQTRQLYRDFGHLDEFRWFPNTRDVEAPAAVRREEVRKLIFVSRLRMTKGLAEVLDACRHLPEHCHLQVFGPPTSDTDLSLFEDHPRATYGGVLEPAEVPRVLSEHDVLLFPSYYENEGYPGVILEAFQCGLPVIASRWLVIPEVVTHEENGLLVEPRSAAAVKSAIGRLLEHPDLYRRLCEGAKRRGEYFRCANWYGRMASDLRALCRK